MQKGTNMTLHPTPRLPQAFRCGGAHCGIKQQGDDLALIVSDQDAAAAALFTRNLFPGAPVILGRETIRQGTLRAIAANSGCSNVGTGEQGLANARRMAAAAARAVGCPPEQVLVSSTGLIAHQLPIERIETGLAALVGQLGTDPLAAARGIMTTDSKPKALSTGVGDSTLTVIAKGAGMIEPNMATMLVYILSDARCTSIELDRMLRIAAEDSLNMLSIDTDTSTSDTCALLANGATGPVDQTQFQDTLHFLLTETARLLARDGEGASKLIEARVKGAASREEARHIAKSIINSPLIKTMAYGADPNVGRILMAVGKCFTCHIEPQRLRALINETCVFEQGHKTDFDEQDLRRQLGGDPVRISVELGVGQGEATAFGCDLTEGYVTENAAYYSS